MTLNEKITHTYLSFHTPKEEAFWASYMGLSQYEEGSLEKREEAYLGFITDPVWLEEIHQALDSDLPEEERFILEGWKKFFSINRIEDPRAMALKKELIHLEGKLLKARKEYRGRFVHPHTGEAEDLLVSKLAIMVKADKDPQVRKAAWEALRDMEPYLMEAGFLEVVKKRNQFARLLGYSDYYDYKSRMYEGLSKEEIFSYLDPLTEAASKAFSPAKAWDMAYQYGGASTLMLDPYLPLEKAIALWGETFSRMGYQFSQAQVTVDLVAREGKYSNGFMHAPLPPYVGPEGFVPGKINFTANAVLGQTGAGLRAMQTLFHEGGHAAHFANVRQKGPVFSQEFPPTSAALAESQSMFADSFLSDPNWLSRYGCTLEGKRISPEEIQAIQEEGKKTLPWQILSMVAVCYAEKALYEMEEGELTPEVVGRRMEEVERGIFKGELCHRPTFSVPHLVSADSSCNYHGYVLAEMAVHQLRSYFYQTLPYVVDNPQVGKILSEKLWYWGSGKSFTQLIKEVTHRDFSSEDIINSLQGEETPRRESPQSTLVPLNLKLTLCHGDELISSSQQGDYQAVSEDFARWIGAQK